MPCPVYSGRAHMRAAAYALRSPGTAPAQAFLNYINLAGRDERSSRNALEYSEMR
jgi:hypothetical protein